MSTAHAIYRHRTAAGKRIFLSVLTEHDANANYAGWLNDPVITHWLETRSATIPKLKKYIREKQRKPDAILYGVFLIKNGQHIGNIKLEPIDYKKRDVVIGMLIGEKRLWGRGIATEVIKLATNYAFAMLKMRTVTLGVIPENKVALHIYQKCGFYIVRTDKNVLNHDGVLYDRCVAS
ncbi:MAG: GNAT family protein [Candidatus Peribacteraceae bacterium]|nr:GNAT family protein [Candidatus Peribacteraceae bacterium]